MSFRHFTIPIKNDKKNSNINTETPKVKDTLDNKAFNYRNPDAKKA
jgi:hypothetical protein